MKTYLGPVSPTLRTRFEARLRSTPAGCIEWQGAKTGGYGMVSIATGISRCTHQVAWFLHYGAWPNQLIMHACDNRACCNVDHLSLGSYHDNAMDASAKGRLIHGHAHHNAVLTSTQIARMKAARAAGAVLTNLAGEYGVSISSVSRICRGEVRARG